jgi:hypothetical protein
MPPAKNAKIAASSADRQQIVDSPIVLGIVVLARKKRNMTE